MTVAGSGPRLRPAVEALVDSAVADRRWLHQHPELSREEHQTQAYILDRLGAIGIEDAQPSFRTGVACNIRGARPGPALLWRADIDGLPLTEDTGLPFASQNDGVMHACGHDGHVAIALGLASALHASRDSLAGTVRFAFQPAEERLGGAVGMIEEGVIEGVDRVFGLHIISDFPSGEVRVCPGPIMAAGTHFRIIVRGKGAHASTPQASVDPIVVAAHAIVALQTVVSRSIDPAETCVITIGRLEGGNRGNIIPDQVMMSGTVRTYEVAVLERAVSRMDELLRGITSAWGASYQFDHTTLPAVVNDPECAAIVAVEASQLLGPEKVAETRLTGSDDMAYFLEERPGCFFLLGGAREGTPYPHHHPRFDFDEVCLPLGIELALRVIEAATGSERVR